MSRRDWIKIGVPACFLYPDKKRSFFEHKTLSFIENDMARYLARHGCMPILIPDLPAPELHSMLDEMQGFLFQGGADIAPQTYKEKPILDGKWPGDPIRDEFEFKILDYVFKHKKPLLGICRGFQIINAYMGGSLYQDIATELSTAVTHRNGEIYDKNHHTIDVVEKSYLSNLYPGQKALTVISAHHQGVKKMGDNLVAQAHCSKDRLLETVAHNRMDDHYIFAVQWHPEFSHTLPDLVPDPTVIMNDFMQRCRS